MKKIKEKFTIVERFMFLLIIIIIAIILMPIIDDRIEKPKIDRARENAESYIKIVNESMDKLKYENEELFNKIIKYNSFSKYCIIKDEEKQILKCGDNEIVIPSNEIIAELDSIIYFSKDGIVDGYKLIIDNYRITYPNSKNIVTIKKYKRKEETITKEG